MSKSREDVSDFNRYQQVSLPWLCIACPSSFPFLAVLTMPFELGRDMEVQEKCVPSIRESWLLLVFPYGITEGPEFLCLNLVDFCRSVLLLLSRWGIGNKWGVWKYVYLSYLRKFSSLIRLANVPWPFMLSDSDIPIGSSFMWCFQTSISIFINQGVASRLMTFSWE